MYLNANSRGEPAGFVCAGQAVPPAQHAAETLAGGLEPSAQGHSHLACPEVPLPSQV